MKTTRSVRDVAVTVVLSTLFAIGSVVYADSSSRPTGSTLRHLDEKIVVPRSGCENATSAKTWIQTREVESRFASANADHQLTLRRAMLQVMTEVESGHPSATAHGGGTEVSAQKVPLKNSNGVMTGSLMLAYASEFVNVGHIGQLHTYRDFSGRTQWRLNIPSKLVGNFGASQTVALGETYYDPLTLGSPVLCLVDEVSSSVPGTRTFIGEPYEAASSLFLGIIATSLPSDCKTYSGGASVVCPAARTAIGTPITIGTTLDLKTSGGAKVGTIRLTGTIQGYSSTGYVKCTTSAACTSFGSYYAPYKYYESTIVNSFTEGTLTGTATFKGTAQAYAKLTLLSAGSPNISIPWCTAMAAFIECFANLSLMADAEVQVSAAGSVTVVITPIQKTTTKVWTTTSNVSNSSKEVVNALTGNVTGMNSLVSTIKMPRFTTDASLTMQTRGGAIGAKAGLKGQIWGQVTLNGLIVTSRQACGSLNWSAAAWVKLSPFPTITYSNGGAVISGCQSF